MIFNSFTFLLFFVLFFALYWFVFNKNLKLQNILLLIASYFFYAWADWRLLSYLIAASVLNYFLGKYIEKENNEKRRKIMLYFGLIQGIGGLFYFKYFNFFIESFSDLFKVLNINFNLQTLNIIIPLGISFFTFRTISYLLDVDKGKIKATKDWIVFFNYVSFFPSLMSGPIDKAKLLVPQLEKKREFDYSVATDGMRQILWGLFKKVVIADNLATITNQIFDNYLDYPGSTLLLGAFFYTIQLYADFSGYTDMAIGIARLIGFKITKNFDFPLFSQNIAEFWRKWHMSLTSWLTEYVFTPLSIAFRDYDKLGLILAILINFTLIGIWHGANWTYVLFGFLHGLFFIPLILKGTMNKKKKTDKNRLIPTFKELINMVATFVLVMLTFVIFRSENINDALSYISELFSSSLFSKPNLIRLNNIYSSIYLILIFVIIEWFGREDEYAIEKMAIKLKWPYRWVFYYSISMIIFLFAGKEQVFIYFQF